MSLLTQLKTDTAPLHEEIERTLDVDRRFHSLESYKKLIARFLGFYRPIEVLLAPHLAGDELLAFDRRRKTRLLVDDLTALGLSADAINGIPLCLSLPRLESPAQALGCLYVLEGSTLGGKIIRQQLARTLKLDPHEGCRFFGSYGSEIGSMWKQFCDYLTQFAADHDESRGDILHAARGTFERFNRWLSEGDRA